MPQVFQGRLQRQPPRDPARLVRATEALFEPITHRRRLDAWITWDGPAALRRAAALLPEGFDGFFVDLTARADPALLPTYLGWLEALRGGRLALQCLEPGRSNEVALDLRGRPPLRLDDPRLRVLDPRPGRQLRYTELSDGAAAPRARRTLAAARVAAAYASLGLPAAFDDWAHEVAGAALEDAPLPPPAQLAPAPWGGPAPAGPPDAAVGLRLEDGTPFALQLTAASPAKALASVFAHWLGWLEQLDVVRVRCTGALPELEALLDILDVEDHPDRPRDAFGVATAGLDEGLPASTAISLLSDGTLADQLQDWSLRWSDLRFRLQGALDAPDAPSESAYVVRSERGQVFDTLTVSLPIDDPDDGALRNARRQLAVTLGSEIGQASLWQLEGQPLDTPAGRACAELCARLEAAKDTARAEGGAVGPPPRRAPAALRWLRGVFRGRNARPGVDLVALMQAAMSGVLAGFRHDRAAHVTDRYFIEFVRRTPHGFHSIQLQRLHAPPGHTVNVGVSRVRALMGDLQPAVGRAVPGLAFPLGALVPERAELAWRYGSPAEARAAVADTVAVLAARAAPFFERAERVLAETKDEPRGAA